MRKLKFSIQKIYKKGSGEVNEDELLIKDNIFGVFDGATSLTGFKNKKGITGGKIAAIVVKKTFSENKKELKKLAIEANNRILSEMREEKVDISKKNNLWLTTAAVAKIKEKEAECFQIGDSLILIIYKNGFYKLLFQYNNHDLEIMKEWKRLADKGIKDIWNKIKPKIKELREKANIKYGVLNGEKGAEKFFNFKKIKLDNIKSIILFSDGLFIPSRNPEDSENWKLFVDIYQKKGLSELLQYVRSLIKENPKYWRYPGFKQYDDAAGIGVDFL